MTMPGAWVWLISGYALLLLVFAWGFDAMAKRTSERAAQWRTGKFVYHEDHDAWKCPEDQWLWPTSFDPANRVMRYRAKPAVCNSCPVKSTCTTSSHGREISREVDPWPHSEAGQFHRGIACVIAGLALILLAATLIDQHGAGDVIVLLTTAAVVAAATVPLARHLWSSPANAPDHLPHRTGEQELSAATVDRFTTRWGGDWSDRKENQ